MWIVKIAAGLTVAYIAVAALMFALQTRMLFPASLARVARSVLPPSSVALEVMTPDREHLKGVFIRANAGANEDRFLVIGFGGNAWNADDVATYLHGLYPEADIVAFHYRGYGPSTGAPSAAALLSDANVVFDYIQKSIGDRRTVAVGFSLGAGVAAHLAGSRPLAGLILVSPFDTLKALAADHYPWLPVKWLLRHHMSVVTSVQGLTIPTAVIVAERDTIVPPHRSEAVRKSISNLVLDRLIEDAGHNDIYDRSDFRATMTEALQKMK